MNNAQRAVQPTPVGGRLTLTSLTPYLLGSVSAATVIYFTPIPGAAAPTVPIWSGTAFAQTSFAEMSQALSDAIKSPGAAAASQVYDLFVWSDGGTLRLSRGPAWSAGATAGSNTARGSGAGSTALTRVQGIPVNKVAIANGPAAGYGTYVGTCATDSSGATVSMALGGAAQGGVAAQLGLWNMYNRAPVAAAVYDTTTSHSLSSSATNTAYNGSAADAIAAVVGLAEDPLAIAFRTTSQASPGNYSIALAANGTLIPGASLINAGPSGSRDRLSLGFTMLPSLGSTTYTILENAGGTVTVFDNGNMALTATILM